MRPIYLIIFLLAGILRLPAQPVNHPIPPEDPTFNALYAHRQPPVLTVQVLHYAPSMDSDRVVHWLVVNPFRSPGTVFLADTLDRNGKLTLHMPNALPFQQVWIEVGRQFFGGLYLNEGLTFDLDGEAASFQGPDGDLNAYARDYQKYRQQEKFNLLQRRQLLTMQAQMNPGPIISEYNQISDSLRLILDAYGSSHPSPQLPILQNEFMSDYYSTLIPMYWNKIMPDSLWNVINRHRPICSSNDGFLFYNYLAAYIRSRGPEKPVLPARTILRIDSLYPPAKADQVKLYINMSTDLEEQQSTLAAMEASMHVAWCTTLVRQQRRHVDDKLAEIRHRTAASERDLAATPLGKPLMRTSFGATLYTAKGLNVDELLGRLRQTFPGKAIVIDRWATWCIPCLDEMSHSRDLQREAKDMPVVFVYLCSLYGGGSEAVWQSKVMEIQQPGVHVLIDSALDAAISKHFSFHGYPGYALIGADGRERPGAISWMREVADEKALGKLIE